MEGESYTIEGLTRRQTKLILVGVLALALIGYVVGLRAGVPEGPPGLGKASAAPASVEDRDAIPAPSYADVGAGVLHVDEGLETWLEMTVALRAKPTKPITDIASRLDSLATRAERRAFNGAPPVIPHAAYSLDDRSCLACHGQDLQVGARTAKRLPHPHLTNCTQCHVPAAPTFFQGQGGVLAESAWVGIAEPKEGSRAMPGAPPAVPHTLQMRDNCLACHGQHGWPGIQTSHPERSNCLQCHAPTEDGAHPGRGIGAPFLLPGLKVTKELSQ